MTDLLKKYFPEISEQQIAQFAQLPALYEDWNAKINVISRKDMPNFAERHVLHSLALAKVMSFKADAKVLDVGTGGGFPAIPLAILFPETKFHAVDSVIKKMKIVADVSEKIGLKNLTFEVNRVEKIENKLFDFVVSRGVTEIANLYFWTRNLFEKKSNHEFSNGIFCLKGGDLKEEFQNFNRHHRFFEIKEFFTEEFFESKKVVYVKVT